MKPMKRRTLEAALAAQGCVKTYDCGKHAKWTCPCGRHSANVPRHTDISSGVVRTTISHLACLPEGWTA